MAELFWVVVFVWALSKAAEKAKKEYRGVRDHHAANLAREHKDWHPARIKRQAALRAQAHWWNQLTHTSGGRWHPFPAFRTAFGESRLRAKAEAAEAHADGVTSRHELRQRIAAAHERAEAARAASRPAPGPASATAPQSASGGAPPLPSETVGGPPPQVPPRDDLAEHLRAPMPDPRLEPCGACGHPGTLADPVTGVEGASVPIHRSHTTDPESGFYGARLTGTKPDPNAHWGDPLPGDCTECGLPLSGEHDGWSHKRCDDVLEKERAATEVRDNRDLEVVEGDLRAQERCPHQTGTDGGNTYCGRDITGTDGDREGEYCPEHQAEADGDEDAAAQEHQEHTRRLLQNHPAAPDDWPAGQPRHDQHGPRAATAAAGNGDARPLAAVPDLTAPSPTEGTSMPGNDSDDPYGTNPIRSPLNGFGTGHGGAPMSDTAHDTPLEDADTPHEAMQNVFQRFSDQAGRTAAAANDDLAAAAAAHGYDRDQQVMQDIADIADQAAALQARAAQARTGLQQRHADGAEYHGGGQDAHASAFRPS